MLGPFNIRNCFKDFFIFVFCFVLYGINEVFLKQTNWSIQWFFVGYYNDLLAPIILLSYINILLKTFFEIIFLNFLILSIFILLVGCFWEYITPYYKVTTSDPNDLLAYYLGFITYWLIRRLLVYYSNFMRSSSEGNNTWFKCVCLLENRSIMSVMND